MRNKQTSDYLSVPTFLIVNEVKELVCCFKNKSHSRINKLFFTAITIISLTTFFYFNRQTITMRTSSKEIIWKISQSQTWHYALFVQFFQKNCCIIQFNHCFAHSPVCSFRYPDNILLLAFAPDPRTSSYEKNSFNSLGISLLLKEGAFSG